MEAIPRSQRRIFTESIDAKKDGKDSLPPQRSTANTISNRSVSKVDDEKSRSSMDHKEHLAKERKSRSNKATELISTSSSRTSAPAEPSAISSDSNSSTSPVFSHSSSNWEDLTASFFPEPRMSPRWRTSTSPQMSPMRLSCSPPSSPVLSHTPRLSQSPSKSPTASPLLLAPGSPRLPIVHCNVRCKSAIKATPSVKITPASPIKSTGEDILPPTIKEKDLLYVPGAHIGKPAVHKTSQRGQGAYRAAFRKTLHSVFCCCSSSWITSGRSHGQSRVAPEPGTSVQLEEQERQETTMEKPGERSSGSKDRRKHQ